jgi:hypothetical protein
MAEITNKNTSDGNASDAHTGWRTSLKNELKRG